ncbi:hypothetical protein GCM10020000_43150 [Streptomyces olivoverticillatus]
MLVNGNTRAAAMREIGQQSMRVGVLPDSFTWVDINAVELSLQLRKDHRRDYSYINRLLAMEEQASLGRTPEVIAKDFRIRVGTYHQERWILSTIRDLIDRSKSGGGVSLRLVDFEDDQEKLKELQRLYEKLEKVEPDQAEVLKEWRLAAILLNFAKTDIRHIDEAFLEKNYLGDALPKGLDLEVGAVEQEAVSIPGLGVAVPAGRHLLCRLLVRLMTRSSVPRLLSVARRRACSMLTRARPRTSLTRPAMLLTRRSTVRAGTPGSGSVSSLRQPGLPRHAQTLTSVWLSWCRQGRRGVLMRRRSTTRC